MSRSHRAFSLILLCGVWMIALGGYFMLVRPALLPEDVRYARTTLGELAVAAPGIAEWLRHVFAVMGGFMSAAGVLTVLLAATAPPTRTNASALGLVGLSSLILMSVVNFAIDSDFKWLLLVPALLWVMGVAMVWRQAVLETQPRAS